MKKFLALVVVVCATACGGGGNGGTEAWVGKWVSAVNEVEVCNGTQHTTPLDGSFSIAQGSGEQVITQSANGCNLTWNVSGDGATLIANQMCSVPGSLGGTWMPTFTDGMLTLSAGVITVGDEGTATLVNGTTTSCTFTQSGSFTKS